MEKMEKMEKIIKKIPVYKIFIDENDNTPFGVNYVALVDFPAIELDWVQFNRQFKFSADKERRLILGAFLIANMPIYRRDEIRGEHYVVFDKETIYQIVQKFKRNKLSSNFNLMHEKEVEGIFLLSDFIIDDTLGIKAPESFKDISQGSWIGTVKVDNEEIWNDYIKSGELKGFSVEGIFAMGEMVRTDEDVLNEIADIVKGK